MATVDVGTTLTGYDWTASPALTNPGFEYSGNQYCFILAGALPAPIHGSEGDLKLHAFKSTDLGATWTEQDSANAPVIGAPSNVGPAKDPSFCICRDGSTVYIVYLRDHISGGSYVIDGISAVSFDLSADTWGTPVDYYFLPHAAPNCPDVDYFLNPQVQFCLIRRGSGDMVFYYTGPREGGLGRVFYTTFDGSNFVVPGIELPNQALDPSYFIPQAAAVIDGSGITHFFYSDNGVNIWHQAMDAAGSFGTRQVVTSAGYLDNSTGSFSSAIVFTTGGDEYITFAGLCDNGGIVQTQRLFYAPTDGTNGPLTWSNSTMGSAEYGDLTITPPRILYLQDNTSTYHGVAISVVFIGGVIVCTWTWADSNISGNGFFYSYFSNFPAISWNSPADLIITGPSANFAAVQVATWKMTGGLVGVLGASSIVYGNEWTQFNSFVPVTVLGISCNSPPNGIIGVPYTHTILAGGGTPPYTFSITGGSLPTGLSLNASTGVISGTPSAVGTFPFDVGVTDFVSTTATVSCSIAIVSVSVLAISCNFPPAGFVGIPYSHTILAVGGTPPYTFAITSGALPTGLSINSSTGVISGTPTVAATYSFQVTVTDFVSATAAVTCSILIYAAGVAGNIYRAFYQ